MAKKNESGVTEQDVVPQVTHLPEIPVDETQFGDLGGSDLRVGDQVLFVLGASSRNKGQERAATIVKLNDNGRVNLNVMIGDPEDFRDTGPAQMIGGKFHLANYWVFDAREDASGAPNTFHRRP
jgi:hypothetical protein